MTIAKRLLLLSLVALIALLLVSGIGFMQTSQTNKAIQYEAENLTPSIELLDEVHLAFYQLRMNALERSTTTEPERVAATDAEILSKRQHIDTQLKKYGEELISNAEDAALLKEDQQAFAAYTENLTSISALLSAGKRAEAEQLVATARELGPRVSKALAAHSAFNHKMSNDFRNDLAAQMASNRVWQIIVVLLSVALTATLSYLTYQRVVSSLAQTRDLISNIANTLDFTRRADDRGRDEIADTARSLNRLIERVQQSLRQIGQQTAQVAQAATNMAGAADKVSRSSAQQSDASGAMAAAIEQMTVSINHVADRAGETNQLANTAGNTAESGATVIEQTRVEISRIEEGVRDAAQKIRKLDADSSKVGAVVSVIKEVAEQTNLLALNAAIEAARAGEHGRGFAVVADEVRKLAERTASSTHEITTTIGNMQSGARSAVEGMEVAVERVERGVERTQEAEATMAQIRDGAQQTVAMVGDISSAISEQSSASASIAQQVERIAQMTEENNVAARTSSDTANEVERLASAMLQEVQQYHV